MVLNPGPNRLKVYAGTLAAMVFWGIAFVWSKIVFEYYGPFTVLFFRMVISTLFLTAYARISGGREKIRKADWPAFLLLSLLQPFCYFIGESFGLMLVSPTLASIIIALIPVVSPVFAYLFLRETLSAVNIAGLAVSFAGVGIFTTTSGSGFSASLQGVMLLMFAVLSAVGYSILVKGLSHRYSPLTIVRSQNLIGGIYFLPFLLATELDGTLAANPPANVIANLVMLAVFGSSLAFIFVTAAIRELGIGKTNVFTNIIPVVTAIAAWMLIGEEFTGRKVLGMTVVIAGILLTQLRRK